ncbi:TPA: c-type cytochrome biogenesis protein CcsB [bacterium]|nr:MAG: c-type cytochrome biogenesis protein CcsB [Candidatus Hydrogenedentes bacterium CG07_land_8_20_14_0_80_42_17]HBW47247.1 c-type cytochrome biogenesis protein CcsB [bacterium]
MYLAATVIYIAAFSARKEHIGKTGYYALLLGGVFNTAAIGIMTVKAGRIPFTNTFETLVLFAWLIVVSTLILEKYLEMPIAGAGASPLALLFLGYAQLQGEIELRPLIPALKSNWLLAHVVSYFIGYSVVAFSYALGVLYLLAQEKDDRNSKACRWFGSVNAGLITGALVYFALHLILSKIDALAPIEGIRARFRIPLDAKAFSIALLVAIGTGIFSGKISKTLLSILPPLDKIDQAVETAIRFSFPFMTLGIVTGAVWANETWGTYWSWDPKETWALITWLIYAAYLHSRIVAGLRGRWTVALAVIGFVIVVFTYFGVNYFLSGLHSYA